MITLQGAQEPSNGKECLQEQNHFVPLHKFLPEVQMSGIILYQALVS